MTNIQKSMKKKLTQVQGEIHKLKSQLDIPISFLLLLLEHAETKSLGCTLLGQQNEQISLTFPKHFKQQQNTLAFEIFTKINCILDHKSASINLKGFKSQKVCSRSPSRTKLEINKRKFSGKSTGISKLYKILINNPGTKEEKEKVEHVLNLVENENTTYQNLEMLQEQ